MEESNMPKLTLEQQIAEVAITSQHQRTGHSPTSVKAVLSKDTLVVTLHGSLSPAERALAKTPEGAAQVQRFHRQLFANSSEPLLEKIKEITGLEVCEATAEVTPTTGTTVQVFCLEKACVAVLRTGDGKASHS